MYQPKPPESRSAGQRRGRRPIPAGRLPAAADLPRTRRAGRTGRKGAGGNPQAGLAAAFEAAPPQIGIPLSDLQRLIEARDKRVDEAAAERVIAGLEAAFRRTV